MSDLKSNYKAEQQSEVKRIKALTKRKNQINHIASVSGWTLNNIRTAKSDASIGDFTQITRLSRTMMGDEIYGPAIENRVNGLLQADYTFEQNDFKAAVKDYNELITQYIEQVWFDYIPEADLEALFTNYLNVGVALAYINWRTSDDTIYPELQYLDTEYLRYDQSVEEWQYTSNDNGLEVVKPGDGNWILITSWKPGQIKGAVPKCAEGWFNKKLAERQMGEANQNHTDSTIILQKSTDQNGYNPTQKDIEDFADQYRTKKINKVLYVPGGLTAENVNSHASYKPDAFMNSIDFYTRQIRVAVLGGNLSDISDQGSFAAAGIQDSAKRLLIKADAQIMTTAIYNQLLKYIVSFNFGDALIQYTPWWNPVVTEAEDLNQSVQILEKLNSIAKDNNVKITNLEETFSRFGIEIKKIEN